MAVQTAGCTMLGHRPFFSLTTAHVGRSGTMYTIPSMRICARACAYTHARAHVFEMHAQANICVAGGGPSPGADVWGQGWAQSRCRRGRGEPSPGADVARVGPVQVQISAGWAQSRCRCGRGRGAPSPGADVGIPWPPTRTPRTSCRGSAPPASTACACRGQAPSRAEASARARSRVRSRCGRCGAYEGRIGEVRWRPRKARRHRFGWVRRTLPSPSVARGHGRV